MLGLKEGLDGHDNNTFHNVWKYWPCDVFIRLVKRPETPREREGSKLPPLQHSLSRVLPDIQPGRLSGLEARPVGPARFFVRRRWWKVSLFTFVDKGPPSLFFFFPLEESDQSRTQRDWVTIAAARPVTYPRFQREDLHVREDQSSDRRQTSASDVSEATWDPSRERASRSMTRH